MSNTPWSGPPANAPRLNPLVRNYQTKDERSLSFCCLQASRYWAELCDAVGRPELGDRPALRRPRRADRATASRPRRILEEAFAERTVAEWRERLADFTGPVVRRAGHARVRGRPAERRQRVHAGLRRPRAGHPSSWSPRRCSSAASRRRCARAPEFNEHGDAILEELGIDWDTIVDLKVRSVVG